MANKSRAIKPIVISEEDVVMAETASEPRYKTIPVDMPTYKGIMQLCEARGLGRRSQGTMVRILVKKELRKLLTDDMPKLKS